jgi:hypothetical protein
VFCEDGLYVNMGLRNEDEKEKKKQENKDVIQEPLM